MEKDKRYLGDVREEYADIVTRLERLSKDGMLSEYEKQTIFDLSKEVLKNLARKYENIREGIGEIMGGYILDYEAKRTKRALEKNTEEVTRKVTKEVTEKNIISSIHMMRDVGIEKTMVVQQLMEKYKLTNGEAEELVENTWQ